MEEEKNEEIIANLRAQVSELMLELTRLRHRAARLQVEVNTLRKSNGLLNQKKDMKTWKKG